jgi:hypothetical protein
MPFGIDDMAFAYMMSQAANTGANLLGGGGEGGPPTKIPSWNAWVEALRRTRGAAGTAQGQAGQMFGLNLGAIQNALAGNMGLSPEMMSMMGQRLNRQLDPSFAQSRDTLRRSFSPRLAGSGAAGSAMQQLLGQQSQSRALGQADIQIQDLLARHQGQMAGLGQMGQMFGQSSNAMQNLLAQLLQQTRTQTQGFMG